MLRYFMPVDAVCISHPALPVCISALLAPETMPSARENVSMRWLHKKEKKNLQASASRDHQSVVTVAAEAAQYAEQAVKAIQGALGQDHPALESFWEAVANLRQKVNCLLGVRSTGKGSGGRSRKHWEKGVELHREPACRRGGGFGEFGDQGRRAGGVASRTSRSLKLEGRDQGSVQN